MRKSVGFCVTIMVILQIVWLSGCQPTMPENPQESSQCSEPDQTIGNSQTQDSSEIPLPNPDGPYATGFQKVGNRFEYPNQVLQAFDYNGVQLLDSPLRDQYQETLEFYLNIPNDDILYTVRMRAGVEAPGTPMGGWYDGGGFCGSTFGQWLSAFARFYAVTGDSRIKEKAQYLMNEWGKLIEDNGFFYFNPTKSSNTWHYTYDKMVLGLTDMYVYMQDDNAKMYLSRITDFAEKYLMRHRTLPTKDNIVGERGSGIGDNEWYTLPENLYRAFLATGDERYKNFAEVWHYDEYWDALREKDNSYWTGLHAYSHVNAVGGAAMLYMLTGQDKYKQTLTGFYEAFTEWEFMSNGAYGIGEGLRGNNTTMADAARTYPYTFETPCCSWATFKLTRYLIGTTGKAEYGDWAEKVLYNGIFAALPMRDEPQQRGQTFYYARYTQKDATKTYYDSPWPCCSGTYALSVAEYPNQIYYKNSEELYVNLFIPSTVTNTFDGQAVTVTQTTSFPQNGMIQLGIETDSPVSFHLKIRAPGWVQGSAVVTINGVEKKAYVTEDGWLYLGGNWKTGDQVTVSYPISVTQGYFDPKVDNVACFLYGPVMLASRDNLEATVALNPDKPVSDYFEPNRENLQFTFKDELGITRTMVPFYSLKINEPYCLNFDLIN